MKKAFLSFIFILFLSGCLWQLTDKGSDEPIIPVDKMNLDEDEVLEPLDKEPVVPIDRINLEEVEILESQEENYAYPVLKVFVDKSFPSEEGLYEICKNKSTSTEKYMDFLNLYFKIVMDCQINSDESIFYWAGHDHGMDGIWKYDLKIGEKKSMIYVDPGPQGARLRFLVAPDDKTVLIQNRGVYNLETGEKIKDLPEELKLIGAGGFFPMRFISDRTVEFQFFCECDASMPNYYFDIQTEELIIFYQADKISDNKFILQNNSVEIKNLEMCAPGSGETVKISLFNPQVFTEKIIKESNGDVFFGNIYTKENKAYFTEFKFKETNSCDYLSYDIVANFEIDQNENLKIIENFDGRELIAVQYSYWDFVFGIRGKTPNTNLDKIEVIWSGDNESYFLKKFKKGDEYFIYRIANKYGNFNPEIENVYNILFYENEMIVSDQSFIVISEEKAKMKE